MRKTEESILLNILFEKELSDVHIFMSNGMQGRTKHNLD